MERVEAAEYRCKILVCYVRAISVAFTKYANIEAFGNRVSACRSPAHVLSLAAAQPIAPAPQCESRRSCDQHRSCASGRTHTPWELQQCTNRADLASLSSHSRKAAPPPNRLRTQHQLLAPIGSLLHCPPLGHTLTLTLPASSPPWPSGDRTSHPRTRRRQINTSRTLPGSHLGVVVFGAALPALRPNYTGQRCCSVARPPQLH